MGTFLVRMFSCLWWTGCGTVVVRISIYMVYGVNRMWIVNYPDKE